MHESVREIAEQKLLVAFQSNTLCEVEEVLLISYRTALVDAPDIEFSRKVECKNSIIINLTENRHVC